MNKIKTMLCVCLLALIMFFATIPKVNAYEPYKTVNNAQSMLLNNSFVFVSEFTVTSLNQGDTFGFLDFDYEYEIIDNTVYLTINRIAFRIDGDEDFEMGGRLEINNTLWENLSYNTVNDSNLINTIYNNLVANTLYYSLEFRKYAQNHYGVYLWIHSYDYEYETDIYLIDWYVTDDNFLADSFLYDIGVLDFAHTQILYEKYILWKYQNDGGVLNTVDDVSFSDWIVNAIGGFFDTDLFGTISLGDIFMFVISIGLLFLLLRFFAGG